MHHSAPARPAAELSCHVDETLDFAMHVAIWDVSSVLAPFAGKDAACWGLLRHGCNGVANKRQSLGFIEERAAASARGKKLVDKRCVDDANKRLALVNESNGDTKHWEEVDIVDSAVQRVNTPCRALIDEVVTACTL